MNEKITLPALIQLLSIATGDTRKQSEDFLKEFFSLISSSLADGETVKIKEFGVFKTVAVDERKSVNVSTGAEHTIPAHRKVVFVPSKEMAALVNEPFEMFETIELSDDYEEEEITEIEDQTSAEGILPTETEVDAQGEEEDNALEEVPAEGVNPVGDDSETDIETSEDDTSEDDSNTSEDDSNTSEDEAGTSEDEAGTSEDEAGTSEDEAGTSEDEAGTSEDESDTSYDLTAAVKQDISSEDIGGEIDTIREEEEPRSKSRFPLGFACGFAAASVCCCIALFVCHYYGLVNLSTRTAQNEESLQTIEEKTLVVNEEVLVIDRDSVNEEKAVAEHVKSDSADSAPAVPTTPSDQKVYDTITDTRYLTTMAKQHYGNFHLWPYIYMENQSFLGHPDRIKPGTKVVVPPLSKYGVDAKNPADIEKAKQLGLEIYARYKK